MSQMEESRLQSAPLSSVGTPPGRGARSPVHSSTAKASSEKSEKGLGWLLLAPIACCGGPLLIGAIAAAGAAAWGGIGAALVVALVATFIVVSRRRRARNCCVPDVSTGGRDLVSSEGRQRRIA